MTFTDGLDYWALAGDFPGDGQPHWQDYSCTAADRSAVLASAVPEPPGSPSWSRRSTPTTTTAARSPSADSCAPPGLAGHAGLHLAAGAAVEPPGAHLRDRGGGSLTAPGSSDWTWHEVTMPVPDIGVIRFGISLTGRGRDRAAQRRTHPGTAGNSAAKVKESMDIPDGNLVRLARDGDPAAFRLLVERHAADRARPRGTAVPAAGRRRRCRAGRLPAGVHRAGPAARPRPARRLAGRHRRQRLPRPAAPPPLTLLGDWPKNLHPASAHGLPSARGPRPCRRAQPRGRRPAPGSGRPSPCSTTPTSPPGRSPALPAPPRPACTRPAEAARYITAHRPDLIPALSRRTPMTAVRIAHADPWPGRCRRGDVRPARIALLIARRRAAGADRSGCPAATAGSGAARPPGRPR